MNPPPRLPPEVALRNAIARILAEADPPVPGTRVVYARNGGTRPTVRPDEDFAVVDLNTLVPLHHASHGVSATPAGPDFVARAGQFFRGTLGIDLLGPNHQVLALRVALGLQDPAVRQTLSAAGVGIATVDPLTDRSLPHLPGWEYRSHLDVTVTVSVWHTRPVPAVASVAAAFVPDG